MEHLYNQLCQIIKMEGRLPSSSLKVKSRELLKLLSLQSRSTHFATPQNSPKLDSFNKLKKTSAQHKFNLYPTAPPAQCAHLTKKMNKIQTNITKHPICILAKKPDLVKNRPSITPNTKTQIEVLQYFTPKTKEEILRKVRYRHPRLGHRRGETHKESICSLKVQDNNTFSHLCHTNKGENVSLGKENRKEKSSSNLQLQSQKFHSYSKSTSFYTLCNYPQQNYYSRTKQSMKQGTKDGKILPGEELISSFTKHELFSYYQSLINFSIHDPSKYLCGFETMLNLMNISANEKIINQWLQIFTKKPTFPEFLYIFTQIVESAIKQSIIDYFEIVFQNYKSEKIDYTFICKLLAERMSQGQASDIADQIYYLLEQEMGSHIVVKDIFELCYRSEDFCNFMRQFRMMEQRREGK